MMPATGPRNDATYGSDCLAAAERVFEPGVPPPRAGERQLASAEESARSLPGDQAAAGGIGREKQWPLVLAAALCWILPATTATRTQHKPLLRVFLLHALLAAAAALLILAFDSWGDAKPFVPVLGEVWHELDETPPGAAWILAFAFAVVEVFHVAVAIVFMPWGARDEPLRNTFRNALRQTWLHTAHFLPAIALVGGLTIGLETARHRWHAAHPPSRLPAIIAAMVGPPAAQPPWYVRAPIEPLLVATGTIAAAWIAFALARAIGACRLAPRIARPPMCASCGYNLTTIAMEGRCPECGSAVSDSLGAMAQMGTPWECPDWPTARIGAWMATTAMALRAPERVGRAICLSRHPVVRGHFLAVHLPCIFVIAFAALLVHIVHHEGLGGTIDLALLAGCVCGTFGVVCVLAVLGVVNLAALIVGLLESWPAKRNMLPASAQVACYLTPYVVAWELLGAGLVLIVINNERFFRGLEESTGVYRDFLAMGAFLVPNAMAAAVYLYLVGRGTKAARYANK